MPCLHSCEYLRHCNLTFCFENQDVLNCVFMDFLENLFMLGTQNQCYLFRVIFSINNTIVISPTQLQKRFTYKSVIFNCPDMGHRDDECKLSCNSYSEKLNFKYKSTNT